LKKKKGQSMKNIHGISFVRNDLCAVCHITDLTDEIKELIRERLSSICHGKLVSESNLDIHSYHETLSEFVKRYEKKSEDTKKGMIGEFLAHLIISEYFQEYHVVSAFFNMEERSVKKGFDVVLATKSDYSIWITEVKSGELHNNTDSMGTSSNLILEAKRDLMNRLNRENRSLWINAINHAYIVCSNNSDLKEAVAEILDDYRAKSGKSNVCTSVYLNAFLVSALFADLSDSINYGSINQKISTLNVGNSFNALFVLSIQKGTYQKVYDFLKKESNQP